MSYVLYSIICLHFLLIFLTVDEVNIPFHKSKRRVYIFSTLFSSDPYKIPNMRYPLATSLTEGVSMYVAEASDSLLQHLVMSYRKLFFIRHDFKR